MAEIPSLAPAEVLTDSDSDDPEGADGSDDGFQAYDLTEDDPSDGGSIAPAALFKNRIKCSTCPASSMDTLLICVSANHVLHTSRLECITRYVLRLHGIACRFVCLPVTR